MLVGSFAFGTTQPIDSKVNHDSSYSVKEKTDLVFMFPDLESLKNFDFNSFQNETELDYGQCTVSVTVSFRGVSATFSVTADTCEEAGAGALSAALGFIRQIRKEM